MGNWRAVCRLQRIRCEIGCGCKGHRASTWLGATFDVLVDRSECRDRGNLQLAACPHRRPAQMGWAHWVRSTPFDAKKRVRNRNPSAVAGSCPWPWVAEGQADV